MPCVCTAIKAMSPVIKNNIDKGLTVWFDPVGDKSKLRNLRGVEIKT